MRNYRISKEAEIKLEEMMIHEEIRMAIQSEHADRSFLTPLAGKTRVSPRRMGRRDPNK